MRTGASESVVRSILEANQFDVDRTVIVIDDNKYSLTEKILRKFSNKEHALNTIIDAIEKINSLERTNSFLTLNDMEKFEWEVFCLLTTMEWFNYADYERCFEVHME
jgi:hypothetical protein